MTTTPWRPANTDWFRDAGWGVFTHYLVGKDLTAEQWNRQVDRFDAKGLARQLESVGAPYYFITIGQNSGHYCSPNATYDRIVGIRPSKCSRRDLVADLIEVLKPKGIRTMVYLPSGAPDQDEVAKKRLAWRCGFSKGWGSPTTGLRLAKFQRNWEAVIREWSVRWGRHVHGWWIDGCYFADDMYRAPSAPNFRSFAEAMKAGNPDSIVAFNPGVIVPVVSHSEFEDYTAGEIAGALPECPGAWVERNEHKARRHILSYLGESWCKGKPRFPDEMVCGYTRHVVDKGGVITWDVPIQKNGLIPETFINQLKSVGQYMRHHSKLKQETPHP